MDAIYTDMAARACSEVGYGLAMQELERGDSGVRSFASVQGSLVMYPIHAFGSEEQKKKYLPEMAKGKIIGCFGLTEPDCGSNPSGMRTVAQRRRRRVRAQRHEALDHERQHRARRARVGEARRVDGQVHGFLVPTDTQGLRGAPHPPKMSLRASVTSELILEDVRVPKDAILPNVRGMKGPLSCLTAARFGIAWGVIGAVTACFDCARRLREAPRAVRRQTDRVAPARAGEVRGDADADHERAAAGARGRAPEGASRSCGPRTSSMIKRHNVRAALEIARTCRDILGGNGITLEYPIMRHLCNLETVSTYEGTHDIHTLILGQDVTGIAAFE